MNDSNVCNLRSIVLLTDFGENTPYVAQMKGVILSINPNATIIDLTHSIKAHGIREAAFVLETSYYYFPNGTIFAIVVDPEVGSERRLICLQTCDYIFMAPDNGILSFLGEKPVLQVSITNKKYFLPQVSSTFHGRDIIAPVAAHLSKGINPSTMGPAVKEIKKLDFPKPQVIGKTIIGKIIFIDRFGSLITDIPQALIKKPNYNKVSVSVGPKKIIRGISNTYADKKHGELMALFGSNGYLEIAVNQGSAAESLHLKIGQKISLITG